MRKALARIALWSERRDRRRMAYRTNNATPMASREIIGAIGWGTTAAWDAVTNNSSAYCKSFEPKVPPSLFVSENDRQRFDPGTQSC